MVKESQRASRRQKQMNKKEIEQIVTAKGYVFDGVVPFKTKDRIRWHNKDLKVAISLGKKIKDTTKEEFEVWVK